MEAYIPGSSLKGKLRHACAQLLGSFGAETGFIDEIFGSAERESKLRFFDSGGVVLEAPEVRYHASLNDMGTVENFFSAEAVPRGKKFGLKIAGKNLEPWQFGLLVAGLKALVDRGMGGECSRGYGTFAVQKISVTLDGKPWEERALLEELRKKLGVERCTG
jgi:CRISPR/Cas system CSM-associated protein Csm3 (group 7 of RAMP superfamily)